MINHNFGYSSG